MWEKYNRWLIECTKKAKTNENDLEFIHVMFGSFLGLSFLTYFMPLLVHLMLSSGFMMVIFFQSFSKHTQVKLRAIDAIGFYLHILSPYTHKRQGEIEEYLIQLAKIQGENPLLSDLFLQRPSFKVLEKESLAAWVKTFVGKEKSLFPLISERVLGCPHLREGLLFWTQLIPRELLIFDDFKTLLLINPVKNKEQLWGLRNFPESNLKNYFLNYSSSDLKRLFTSSFYLNDYLEFLTLPEDII